MEKEKIQLPIIQISVFSGRIVFPVFYSLISSLLLPASLWYILTSTDLYDILPGVLVFVFTLFLWVVMVWGELRLKMSRLYFKEGVMEIISFWGLWGKRICYYEHITGFKTLLEPALPTPYECITLMNGEKKLLRISQFYYSNYDEIKLLVTNTFQDLGREEFSTKRTFADIFKS